MTTPAHTTTATEPGAGPGAGSSAPILLGAARGPAFAGLPPLGGRPVK
ncbi:hypothetical protein ACFFSH_02245 [Streptomyces filamentosus]|nr:hypothetical protein [Streptomyces filamentosus]